MAKKTIRGQLVRQYAALSALVILLYSIFCFIIVQRTYQDSNEAAYEQQAELFCNDLSSSLASHGRYVSMLAQNTSLINLISIPNPMLEQVQTLNEIIEPNIYFFLLTYPTIKDIVIYSDFEVSQIPSSFFRDIAAIEEAAWYRDTVKDPQIYWFTEGNRLFINSAVYNFMGDQILGIVQFEIDLPDLIESIHTIDIQPHLTVKDTATGNCLYSNYSAEQSEKPGKQWTHSLSMEIPSLEIQYYANYVSMPWKFFWLILPALLVTILACIASIILIRFFANSVTRKIHRVIDAINHIAQKDFDVHIPVAPPSQRDELDELAGCLNDMSSEISRLIAEIKDGKDREKEAELQTLQAKINPHFLYNILDSIGWCSLKSNMQDIRALTSLLAIYYRTNLNNGQLLTTVENELENIKAYAKLQLYMSDHSFDVEYEVEQDILNLPVCNFILQPLVENAILHGVKGLYDRRGRLLICAERNGDCIDLSVTDNGYGISQEKITTIMNYQGHSYGIKNVQERIKLHYGEQYGIRISSELEVGTTATIHLPIESIPKGTRIFSPLA